MILIGISVISCRDVFAIKMEVFQKSKITYNKTIKRRTNKEYYYGIYISDILSSPNGMQVLSKVKSFEKFLESKGLRNGKDYYYNEDYLFYLPIKTTHNVETTDQIYELSRVIEEYEIHKKVTKNPHRKRYITSLKANVKKNENLNDLILPVQINTDTLQMSKLKELLEHRLKKRSVTNKIKEIKEQLKNIKQNRYSIRNLVKKYSTLNAILRDLNNIQTKKN